MLFSIPFDVCFSYLLNFNLYLPRTFQNLLFLFSSCKSTIILSLLQMTLAFDMYYLRKQPTKDSNVIILICTEPSASFSNLDRPSLSSSLNIIVDIFVWDLQFLKQKKTNMFLSGLFLTLNRSVEMPWHAKHYNPWKHNLLALLNKIMDFSCGNTITKVFGINYHLRLQSAEFCLFVCLFVLEKHESGDEKYIIILCSCASVSHPGNPVIVIQS